jgi:hypothetical protein
MIPTVTGSGADSINYPSCAQSWRADPRPFRYQQEEAPDQYRPAVLRRVAAAWEFLLQLKELTCLTIWVPAETSKNGLLTGPGAATEVRCPGEDSNLNRKRLYSHAFLISR